MGNNISVHMDLDNKAITTASALVADVITTASKAGDIMTSTTNTVVWATGMTPMIDAEMASVEITYPEWFMDDYGHLLRAGRDEAWVNLLVAWVDFETLQGFPTGQVSSLLHMHPNTLLSHCIEQSIPPYHEAEASPDSVVDQPRPTI